MGGFNWRLALIRLLQLVLLGTITVGAVVEEIRPLLEFLAGAGGGYLASKLFTAIRTDERLKAWIEAPGQQALKGVVAWLFFSPATAAGVVFFLGALVSAGASFALSWASGAPLNEAWGVLVSFLASQATYFFEHPNPFPVDHKTDNAGRAYLTLQQSPSFPPPARHYWPSSGPTGWPGDDAAGPIMAPPQSEVINLAGTARRVRPGEDSGDSSGT